MPAPNASDPTPGLTASVHAALDARLEPRSDRPIALALSGGGDSVALLALAAAWARTHGRSLLALTVDHGLNPDSARWSKFARDTAARFGADWRGLTWPGAKPANGLPAAARQARHRLLAEAARETGARVILFGHTADDVAESDWMRARGSTLGRLRDWSPSPVWPEGRDLMLARPLLGAGRAALRDWLIGQGLDWIDDPGNEDEKFSRSRARLSLLEPFPLEGGRVGMGVEDVASNPVPTVSRTAPDPTAATPNPGPSPLQGEGRRTAGAILKRSLPADGVFSLPRSVDVRALAAALVCAGGGDTPPRGDRLSALSARLRTGEDFTATLCGARIEASGDTVTVLREAGERRRGGLAPVRLSPDHAVVWDGRFEIDASPIAGVIAAAAGHLATLDPADRALLATLPSAVRPTLPVLFRDDDPRPVLAWRAVRMRCLVASRFALATARVSREGELDVATVGEIAPNILFQQAEAKPSRRVHLRT